MGKIQTASNGRMLKVMWVLKKWAAEKVGKRWRQVSRVPKRTGTDRLICAGMLKGGRKTSKEKWAIVCRSKVCSLLLMAAFAKARVTAMLGEVLRLLVASREEVAVSFQRRWCMSMKRRARILWLRLAYTMCGTTNCARRDAGWKTELRRTMPLHLAVTR
jgi:hypothetical protein